MLKIQIETDEQIPLPQKVYSLSCSPLRTVAQHGSTVAVQGNIRPGQPFPMRGLAPCLARQPQHVSTGAPRPGWARRALPLAVPQKGLVHFSTREQCTRMRQQRTRTLLCPTKPGTGRLSRVWKDMHGFWGRAGRYEASLSELGEWHGAATESVPYVQHTENPGLETSCSKPITSYNAFAKESKQKMNARRRMVQEEAKDPEKPRRGWGLDEERGG